MPRQRQRVRLVVVAIHVCDVEIDLEDGGFECHRRYPAPSSCNTTRSRYPRVVSTNATAATVIIAENSR